ncbi:hypothetical protein ABTH66_19645, partial [Acinetobacter baumannii]
MLEAEINELPAASPTPSTTAETTDEVVQDPLLQAITTRLDALFAAGEFGLAYHLRRCARSVLPSSPDIYA